MRNGADNHGNFQKVRMIFDSDDLFLTGPGKAQVKSHTAVAVDSDNSKCGAMLYTVSPQRAQAARAPPTLFVRVSSPSARRLQGAPNRPILASLSNQ